MAGRMVCRLCPGWGEGAGSGGQRGGARARGRGGWAPWGGILAPCLGVLTPFPEAGGSEDKGVHLGGTDLGVMGHTYTGGNSGLGWEIWVSAACKGNQRTSRIGWGPQHRMGPAPPCFRRKRAENWGPAHSGHGAEVPELPGGWSAGSGRS